MHTRTEDWRLVSCGPLLFNQEHLAKIAKLLLIELVSREYHISQLTKLLRRLSKDAVDYMIK